MSILDDILSTKNQSSTTNLVRKIKQSIFIKILTRKENLPYVLFLMFVSFMAVVGPYLTPYEYNERIRTENGELLTTASPSLQHPLGTTNQGYDLLARVVFGAQPTLAAGIIGGLLIITIGLTIGLTSGYVGGRVDDIFMRFTDLVYGIPLIPFALVLVAFFGIGFWRSILVVGLVLWRSSARVIRSQVLQIKERPFMLRAQAMGASTPHIIIKHALPNVAPMAFLFFALGTGSTIIIIAGLAFLGVTNPFVPSWGVMIRNAYNSGLMTQAPMWAVAPGILISLTVLSLFMLGRSYEMVATGDNQDDAIAKAG